MYILSIPSFSSRPYDTFPCSDTEPSLNRTLTRQSKVALKMVAWNAKCDTSDDAELHPRSRWRKIRELLIRAIAHHPNALLKRSSSEHLRLTED
ncbi:hypothetical protein KC345_g281 [Hortaea werneckii]|nr:hypothetical protein KC345_g281 [Hortaea werneckii]